MFPRMDWLPVRVHNWLWRFRFYRVHGMSWKAPFERRHRQVLAWLAVSVGLRKRTRLQQMIKETQDPWYVRAWDRISGKALCLTGRHQPKLGLGMRCYRCMKRCEPRG